MKCSINKKYLDSYPWLGMDEESINQDVLRHYHLTLGQDEPDCDERYLYQAVALTVRDRLVERWRATRERYRNEKSKQVAYLSMEFLMGRALSNAALNLDIEDSIRLSLKGIGCAMEEVIHQERDAGLGNGGLGRLAACFLDSCSTLGYPVTGYGIRYDYGIFHQKIKNGYQEEVPDHWLEGGSPWEFVCLENARLVKFGGYTEVYHDNSGGTHVRWLSDSDVMATPHDIPIPGYKNDTVNTLRLWKADSTNSFDLADFNAGEHNEAFISQNEAAQISMVLYPNDASVNGKALRLRQQYFLSSASLQDVLAHWLDSGESFTTFPNKHCFQLNDTHPAVAIAELMRLLIDDYHRSWDEAWSITTNTMAYTNHTLLPEALERWPIKLFEKLLPRLLEIIYEINHRFLEQVRQKWPEDPNKIIDMSIIQEGDNPQIRMAYLAIVGSFSINGVAELHTQLLEDGLFKDFYSLWPERFSNKTNGVSPRRWLAFCNPKLADLISSKIGENWINHLSELEKITQYAEDKNFCDNWYAVKKSNKQKLADLVMKRSGVDFDPEMMFDIQVKRIHEYKRQLLNVLHIINLYDRIIRGDTEGIASRCILIGGKAAPGYFFAKLIIKLVNNVAAVVNSDPRVKPLLRVAFLPNFQVTTMEIVCPAADLSEQISTAGKEASGTGNMKFMMNGAITIGTLDGANIEIKQAVGDKNFFLFGLTVNEIAELNDNYSPDTIIESDKEFSNVMELLASNLFCMDTPGLFVPIYESIKNPQDPWYTAADFRSYVDTQKAVDSAYQDKNEWTKKSILNTAGSGYFSSDRTINEYATQIWKLD